MHGTGTNLKVGEGTPIRRKAPKKILVVPLHFFGSKSTISRFGVRFRDGQYSLVSFLFAVFSTHGAPCPGPYGVGVTGSGTDQGKSAGQRPTSYAETPVNYSPHISIRIFN